MSDTHQSDTHGSDSHGAQPHGEAHHVNYKKIYVMLLVLLGISILGPEFGIEWVTLVTAFGVALYKAYLVIENFMHLRWEKRIMKWVLTTSLVLVALMYFGVAPDVMRHTGRNWVNESALAAIERGAGGEHGGEAEEVVVADAAPGAFSAETTFTSVCAACHGVAGDGNGPAGALLDPHPANFTDPVFWETRDEARIIKVITDGAASVGGSPLMVAWKNLYTAEQIGQLADYVMSFRPAGQ